MPTSTNIPSGLSLLVGVIALAGCGAPKASDSEANAEKPCIDCAWTAIDPSGPTGTPNGGVDAGLLPNRDSEPPPPPPGRPDDGIHNGTETDVDCGGTNAPKCLEGQKCLADGDCTGACSYAKKCIGAPSCKPHLGGDTCGKGEVGQPGTSHESCCRSLPVAGYVDAARPGKAVYLDKYEITTGRVRAFLANMAARYGGAPNVRAWIAANTPAIWDPAWSRFLPSDVDGDTVVVERGLLGDPRGTWPGAPPVPATDEPRKTGTDFQFNGSFFVYLHGNNCCTHSASSYGFPTWFYPDDVLAKLGPMFPPRAPGRDLTGAWILASEHLEVKAMNCIPNALLQAFCHWDGGQLATNEVLDYVTATPPTLGNRAGCGTQVAQDPPTSTAATTGGRCADLAQINATYDAGGGLPSPNHPLNANNYMFPFFAEGTSHDKAWQIAAPGRASRAVAAAGEAVDQVRINAGDEPWMDLAGNVNEVVLKMDGATFTGKFGLKFRGIGFQSARSQLNSDPQWDQQGIARLERPEAKAAFAGGRCMRFQ